MKDIHQLQEEFDILEKSDYLAMIKFYESNINSIKNIDSNIDNNHYDCKMLLQSEYGISLVSAGYYSKITMILADSIKMFENAPNVDLSKLYEITFFEYLLFNYGIALCETKKMSEASDLFERLVKYFPENEKYNIWLNWLKTEEIKKIIRPLYIVIGIWLVAELTIFEKFDQSLQLIFSLVGILFLVIIAIAELYIYFAMNKKSKLRIGISTNSCQLRI